MGKVISRGIILSISDFAVLVELWCCVRFSCTSVLIVLRKERLYPRVLRVLNNVVGIAISFMWSWRFGSFIILHKKHLPLPFCHLTFLFAA